MALIKIRVAAVIAIVFTEVYANFIREKNETKTVSLSYTNGSGQTLVAGQKLYSVGTAGTLGYLSVKVKNNTIINGSGSFDIDITSYANATQPDGAINFNYNGNPIKINIDYNSNPEITDITFDILNRSEKTFSVSDFENAFTDLDGDTISEIMIEGDVTGYKFEGDPYVSGTWIFMSDVNNLKYIASDANEAYEKNNNWKAKDSAGYVSN